MTNEETKLAIDLIQTAVNAAYSSGDLVRFHAACDLRDKLRNGSLAVAPPEGS